MCVQGNFCIYKVTEDDASSSDKSNKVTIKVEDVEAEAQADDDKEDESKVNKKLKLSAGLPACHPIEVKVMVYIVRVGFNLTCLQHCLESGVYSIYDIYYALLTS